jgi:hypothetical protein
LRNGGGLFLGSSGSLDMKDTVISQNVAERGGGICLIGSIGSPAVTNCLITENSASDGGGGVFCQTELALVGCTISDNSAGQIGGGIQYSRIFPESATASITDSILSGNSAPEGSEIAVSDSPPIPLSYSAINGGAQTVYVSDDSSFEFGDGIIADDPLFAAGPLGEYYLSQAAAGQGVTSPCVDAGSDTAANLGLDSYTTRSDQAGDGGQVDMGYHYPIVEITELSQINLVTPANAIVPYSPPTFAWKTSGGANNAFVVDGALSVDGPYHSSPVIIGETHWTMPQASWDAIPPGSYVFWYVRGADLDAAPLKVIYSDEFWFFYKP